MDDAEWSRLSPEQQAEAWRQHNAQQGPPPGYQPPAPAPAAQSSKPGNIAGWVALACGGLALLIVPVLFGAAAVIAGTVAGVQSWQGIRKNNVPGAIGAVVGLIAIGVAFR